VITVKGNSICGHKTCSVVLDQHVHIIAPLVSFEHALQRAHMRPKFKQTTKVNDVANSDCFDTNKYYFTQLLLQFIVLSDGNNKLIFGI